MQRVFSKKQTVRRYAGNPVLSADQMPFNCRGVYNSSVVKHEGRYVMILRCEGYNFYNFFALAESSNGIDGWQVGEIIPLPEDPDYKRYARVQYDPRITRIGDTYYVTYCAHASDARMALLSSKDMRSFQFEGFISGTGFRNTVLFPEKIDGLYTALERPNARGEIWVTQSPDLKFWGQQRLLMDKSKCSFGWGKIGPCGTPIKTEQGWLIIFHAVSVVCDHEYIYNAGVALAKLEAPWELVRVGDECILTPEMPYENAGHTPNCVFASSHVVEDDGSVKLYYGASDRYQCVAETSVAELLEVALQR
ncbi:MAG TPA: glycoside hydrolase family 130 protein [Polyangiaceae bacterium]|jgi:predicted GH43/DUF377 family glycosyl hydrolase|nr:glycoside hydrolase family 130 protein [Polyangiaceae bacterium]